MANKPLSPALKKGLELRLKELQKQHDARVTDAMLDGTALIIGLAMSKAAAKNLARNKALADTRRIAANKIASKIGEIEAIPTMNRLSPDLLFVEGTRLFGAVTELIRKLSMIPADQAAELCETNSEHITQCLMRAMQDE
jgi:hypothetical protein